MGGGACTLDVAVDVDGECISIGESRLGADEYIAFLARSGLGQQYPKERFRARIGVLVASVQISLVARNEAREVVGMCFGLTDFAYWLFLTDLGVDRRYEGKGIGRRLVQAAHALAGGEREIVLLTNANDDAIPFYEKLGMKLSTDVYARWDIDWTSFEVGKDELP